MERLALLALVAVLAMGVPYPTLASSEVTRVEFFNANLSQQIDVDSSVSFSAWSTTRRISERDGGPPAIVETATGGYCFIITTCVSPSGPCTEDTRTCGEFDRHEQLKATSTRTVLTLPDFLFDYTIIRRAVTTRSEHNRTFEGSVTEDASRTVSSEGLGALSSPYGYFSGRGYHNQGFTRHREHKPRE